ncbi:sarcolemmal membrane-associated [Fusarium longipes]|uniref:Sarcolemmal membrane-associated n=1 Tax=Fusarium longipes TaxID=694270 RepID=A0A395RQA3_9HYPO|nr:sarcolemmal membrane-associated [Fusarium longipes]
MAVPEYRDEVLITLSSVNPPPNFAFKKRQIFLTKKNPTIQIGRTSKRKASLEAGKSNTWFDSAVMSRNHAVLTFDAETQKVYIKDTESLHGTYKNDARLNANEDTELSSGDKLMFGTSIDRGMERYPPTRLETVLKYGSLDPEQRGNCFRVPDESDCEAVSSDDDQVQHSCKMLYTRNVRPSNLPTSSSSHSPIDLTHEADQTMPTSTQTTHPVGVPDEEERPSQPISNDAFSLGENHEYVWSDDEDQDDRMDDNEDEEIEEESPMAPEKSVADADSSEPAWDYSPVDDADDIQESMSTGDNFEDDEFEDHEDPDLIDSDNLLNDDTKADDECSAQHCSADSGTAEMDVTKEPIPKAPSQTELSDTIELKKVQAPKENDVWRVFLSPDAPPPVQSFSLPPISEMAPEIAAAEIMGRKVGKSEYFAAREVNKATAMRALPPFRPPSSYVVQSAPLGQITEQVPRSHKDSELVASNTRFLDTLQCPFLQSEPETHNAESNLDETSAFRFEQSKKALATVESVMDELQMAAPQEINQEEIEALEDAVEDISKDETASATRELSRTPKSSKRKAEEISELITEERLAESEEPVVPQQATCRPPKRPTHYLRQDTRAAVTPPPPKRLRRMAEVVGYATLGGVAVMSALIATAPSL